MTRIYIVQDHQNAFRGAFSTLALAKECYIDVRTEVMTSEAFQAYVEHLADGYWDPQVVVYEIDGNYIWSYGNIDEIDSAITNGETYDDQ